MINWMHGVLDLIYPPRCLFCQAVICRTAYPPLCRDCTSLFVSAGPFCPRCQQIHEDSFPCSCDLTGSPLQGLFALALYEGEWRKMLHRFKFAGHRSLSRPLGAWMGRFLNHLDAWPLDMVAPLPLHPLREKMRGYNQTYLIARYAALELKLPLVSLLKKIRSNSPQTGLSRQERMNNVDGVFTLSVKGRKVCRGAAVLLVDDIYSTGATLNEAAAELAKRGAIVYGAVAAYNPRLY